MRDVEEIPTWLQRLPLAPEFRPTDTEFADPISYISKIEKEVATAFGICKIIPPLPKPSKKHALRNLNRSLSNCPDYDHTRLPPPAVFTTRQQELGQTFKKSRPAVQKQVWQSGEVYTLAQFETKAKAFAKCLLSAVKDVSAEVVEAMFWKATFEKPMYIEYANDVPGSGFSEPEGSHRYFFKRRRKRIPSTPSATVSLEGTAGWKLSNSPWNLQVIARSPGSLTRFMPDDIPGVTSPMLYIGMLFSWFAWHVEDHELHSMNYLHTGSPKTWYAVPGDYAYQFEELIRTQGYGGNIDRLAALKLLGEKTTLLSPEVVVASGIPCCRIVQHPGEFVVTFPRAYHIGFSHGFNCGEAANFGTPQWLEVAKEAAVRRAAMNFLPMLSHQQLLYLLTMSFFSRVPRSLLPGARSSRLRDRQKEEREKLVKKAFIQDILKESKLSTILLARASAYRAVIWDPESLPSVVTAVNAPVKEIGTSVHSHDNESQQTNLFDEMSYLMETVNDLYLDDDDLSSDFQVNSGPLACVSCGILGFPFMSVVQPSERALMELAPKEYSLLQEGSTTSKSINTYSSSDNGDIKSATSENISHVPDHFLQLEDVPSTTQFDKAWNASSGFLRPRIFCLEHAIQIEDLLQAKGGANVLVICHSDYQKMKAHTAAIVEEIKCPFKISEAPLDCASQGDLNLINLAIEEDKRGDECGEDWTSKLGINLRYCVKMRKKSSSPRIQHTLTLDGLFYDSNPTSTTYLKWQSKRSRSKYQLIHSDNLKPCQIIQIKDEKCREELDDGRTGKKENTILQYSRRKLKKNSVSSAEVSTETNGKNEITVAEDLHSHAIAIPSVGIIEIQKGMEEKNVTDEVYTQVIHSTSERKCDLQTDENVTKDNYTAEELCIGANVDDKIQHEIQTRIRDPAQISGSTYVSLTVSDTPSAALIDERFEAPQETCVAEDLCNSMTLDDKVLTDILTTNENSTKTLCNGMTDEASIVLSNGRSEPQQSTYALDTEPKHEIHASNVSGEEPAQGVLVSNQYLFASTGESFEVISPAPDEESVEEKEKYAEKNSNTVVEVCFSEEITEQTNTESNSGDCESNASRERKRKREVEVEQIIDDKLSYSSFFRSPCEGLRSRAKKDASTKSEQTVPKKMRKSSEESHVLLKGKKVNTKIHPHSCDLDSCRMRFRTKADLHMHKRNQCHHRECGKRFRSHKYTILHARVHDDERPLKCTWKGCTMSFKWAWARTEHLRVHTGERPYQCKVEDCGLSFRYISDFSRHRRKTGHLVS